MMWRGMWTGVEGCRQVQRCADRDGGVQIGMKGCRQAQRSVDSHRDVWTDVGCRQAQRVQTGTEGCMKVLKLQMSVIPGPWLPLVAPSNHILSG